MNGYLQPIAAVFCVAAASVSAPAYAQQWQGAWDTTYGQLRLVQDGDHVFGDYRDGTIEGIYDASSGVLRAVFRNPDGATGYAEFQMQSDFRSFVGAWNWAGSPLPDRRRIPDDRRWTGQRTATTAPPIVNFRLPGNRSRLLSSAPAKYRDWVSAFNRPAASAVTSSPSTPSTGAITAAPKVNPLTSRFPKLRDYPADFVPTAIEIDLREVVWALNYSNLYDEPLGQYSANIYGTYGVYFYCETQAGSRELPPMNGLRNRVFDKSRQNAVRIQDSPSTLIINTTTVVDENQGIRRFALDQQCLNTPGSRFAVQLQTNLNERQGTAALDRKFGYRSFKFYLDQVPAGERFEYNTASTSQSVRIGNRWRKPERPTETHLVFAALDRNSNRMDVRGKLAFVR